MTELAPDLARLRMMRLAERGWLARDDHGKFWRFDSNGPADTLALSEFATTAQLRTARLIRDDTAREPLLAANRWLTYQRVSAAGWLWLHAAAAVDENF